MKNLSELSQSYYEQAHVYKLFTEAEDFQGLIYQKILPLVKNKKVLDLGCGNGKYIDLFYNHCSEIIGIDKSIEQLKYIKNAIPLLCADAQHLPLTNNSVDIVFSSWMLGTILDKNKQIEVLQEMKRVVRKGGKIILVENDEKGEFEVLRSRYPDKLQRTKLYNDWLIEQGFSIFERFKTYFEFETLEAAQTTFDSIWAVPVPSSKIEHNIVIFTIDF